MSNWYIVNVHFGDVVIDAEIVSNFLVTSTVGSLSLLLVRFIKWLLIVWLMFDKGKAMPQAENDHTLNRGAKVFSRIAIGEAEEQSSFGGSEKVCNSPDQLEELDIVVAADG